jgi:putative FmdB family regulatory protein
VLCANPLLLRVTIKSPARVVARAGAELEEQVMPPYEYQCEGCGKRFTRELSVAEHETQRPTCPKCGGQDVKQSVSTVFVKTSKKS